MSSTSGGDRPAARSKRSRSSCSKKSLYACMRNSSIVKKLRCFIRKLEDVCTSRQSNANNICTPWATQLHRNNQRMEQGFNFRGARSSGLWNRSLPAEKCKEQLVPRGKWIGEYHSKTKEQKWIGKACIQRGDLLSS